MCTRLVELSPFRSLARRYDVRSSRVGDRLERVERRTRGAVRIEHAEARNVVVEHAEDEHELRLAITGADPVHRLKGMLDRGRLTGQAGLGDGVAPLRADDALRRVAVRVHQR